MNRIITWYLIYAAVGFLIPPLIGAISGRGYSGDSISCEGKAVLTTIENNQDALYSRLEAIRNARSDILFATFDLRDDDTGKDLMAALCDAADRGVKVRILVDGTSDQLRLQYGRWFRALTSHPNIEAKIYNPVHLWNPWAWNYRLHEKYLILDQEAFILGGRNSFNSFLGQDFSYSNEDRDVIIRAISGTADVGRGTPHGTVCSAAEALSRRFDALWNLPESRRLIFDKRNKNREKRLSVFRQRWADIEREKDEQMRGSSWNNLQYTTDRLDLIMSAGRAWNKNMDMWNALSVVISGADDAIVETPYLICSRQMYHSLERAADGASDIRFIVNSPENDCNPWGPFDYLVHRNHILSTGVAMYEWDGSHSMHSKMIVAGSDTTVIGSFNCDLRSVFLDTEIMVNIHDCPELNQQMRRLCSRKMRQSVCRTLSDTTEGPEHPPAHMPVPKKILYGIMRWLIQPFRYLL